MINEITLAMVSGIGMRTLARVIHAYPTQAEAIDHVRRMRGHGLAFTTPPIASVGMSEQQVRDSGMKFRMKSERASRCYTARRVAEAAYGFKVLVDESTDPILGAHLIGPHCEEVINIFALAIREGLTAEDLKTTMFAYPTTTSDIGYML